MTNNYQSEQIGELAKALSNFQGKLEGVEKDSTNPFFKSKYADLHAVWQAIRKPLSENGLSVTQIAGFEGEKSVLITVLMHSSGQWIRSEMPIITSKADIQSYGGAVTYLKRYSLQAIVGCSSYDDDGEEAMKPVRSEKPKPIVVDFVFNDLAKCLIEFSKEDLADYVKYIAITLKTSEEDVINQTLSSEDRLKSFREKLKSRLDKKISQ